MPLWKWQTFWVAPWLICCLTVILLHIERKWLFMRNFAKILPLKSKLPGKFQRFNAINRSIEMLKIVEFPKISIKLKNFKTLYESQTAICLKRIVQPSTHPRTPTPHQIKTFCVSVTKIFERRFTGIYRYLLSKCSENAVFGLPKIVQCKCFFWHRSETFLVVLREYIFYNIECVEVRKMSEVF